MTRRRKKETGKQEQVEVLEWRFLGNKIKIRVRVKRDHGTDGEVNKLNV